MLLAQVLASAADNYVQILFPVPMPAAGRDPSAPVSGTRGLGAAAISLVAMTVDARGRRRRSPSSPGCRSSWASAWLFVLTLPLALAGACAVYFMATSGAARLLMRREPELLARLRGDE